jgi:hypothetical protein
MSVISDQDAGDLEAAVMRTAGDRLIAGWCGR